MTHSEMLDYLDRDKKLIANVRTMLKTEDDLAVCDGIAEALEAAIAALTPRVMTLEEIRTTDGAVFLEYRHGDYAENGPIPGLLYHESRHEMLFSVGSGVRDPITHEYGDTWRGWTRRPTPEDMAREPWQAKQYNEEEMAWSEMRSSRG